MDITCNNCHKKNEYKGTKKELSRGGELTCVRCKNRIVINKGSNGMLKVKVIRGGEGYGGSKNRQFR